MKLYLDDILKTNWLVEVLKAAKSSLLTLKPDAYLVIFYKYEEYTSSINVSSEEVRYIINDDIYRKLSREQSAEFVGYFKFPLETNSFLFYSYLKYCNKTADINGNINYAESNKKLNSLFLNFREEDKKKAKEKSINSIKGIFSIKSSLSLISALEEIFPFNKKPLIGLNLIFDMLSSYYKKLGVNLYGDVLHSFVRLVKNPSGGIIPQANGKIRYLIIGENVAKNDLDLVLAKEQLRQGLDYNTIFLNTGWFFNKYDSKWRKNILNGYFSFKENKVTINKDYILSKSDSYLTGESGLFSDLKNFNKNKMTFNNLILNGYNNKLGDIFDFETAYDKYPKLKEIFSIVVGGKDREFLDMFYYTKQSPERIVLMRGTVDYGVLEYILLHEIQHYIQKVEGFGNGGNLYLADVINSVGGDNTRQFLNTMSSFVDEIYSKSDSINIENLRNSIELLNDNTTQEIITICNNLLSICESNLSLKEAASDFGYILLNLYTYKFDKKRIIIQIIEQNFDKKYITLFQEILKQSELILLKNSSLISKGWTARDIYMLNFQTYQALLGETESRFVQNTSKIDEELNDYFSLYSSETIDPYKVTVLNEARFEQTPKIINAAIEQANGSYIIHLPSEFSNSVNILHEVGHIIFDNLMDLQLINILDYELISEAESNGYEQLEEYICDSFVDYIHRRKFELGLVEDLDESRKIKDFKTFDKYFESILLSNPIKINELDFRNRIDFVNKVLNLA